MKNSLFVTITKLSIGIILLPVVIASITAFHSHLKSYPSAYYEMFMGGVVAFLIIFLFLYQFWGVYEFGQKIVAGTFSFVEPFDKFFVSLIPFFVLLFFCLFLGVAMLEGHSRTDPYFVFFMGFTLSMHLLLTAQDLQMHEKTPLKPNYLIAFSIIFILNILLIVFFLDIMIGRWTFSSYIQDVLVTSMEYYGQLITPFK